MALNLWLIDRSGHESGMCHCRRYRYLTRHAGPHGYGWVRRAQSIPQITGTHVHNPLGGILKLVQATDTLPSDTAIYEQIVEAIRGYRAVVEARGIANILDPEEVLKRTREQEALLEGLVWTWVRGALPQFHQQYRLLSVEEEDVTVLGCTCGLGDKIGTAFDHDVRECEGIGWMTRGDAIAARRQGGGYAYHEFKTTSVASMNWELQWYFRTQLVAGVIGAEAKHDILIDEVDLHALIKGQFRSEWNPAEGKATGPKYQSSRLVYAGRRLANPPLWDEDWSGEWAGQFYKDEEGKNRKRGKEYERTGIWMLPESWWKQSGGLSPSHWWTGALAAAGLLGDSYRMIGPIYRNPERLQEFTEQLVPEERRWQDALGTLYDLSQTHGWGSREFDRKLNEVAPMSRGDACQSYFGDQCEMVPLCGKEQGWQDPELIGYIPRRPHHQPELDQAIERGLLPPEEGVGETREEGGE